LKKAREHSGIKQGEMARRLGVTSSSVVSRLEKSPTADHAVAERYLRAIDTEYSRAILDFYGREWRISTRPDFTHPNKEALWEAEQALQRLEAFERDKKFDALLATPLNFVRGGLEATAEYIGRTDHSLAWIGTVGVGKTTALSHLTNLVMPGTDGRPRPIFPASGGRTTTSEVVVRPAPAFGIAVEPKPEDEIRLLVTELVTGVLQGSGGISTELERALRNMADLHKSRDPSNPKLLLDPIRDLGGGDQSIEDVVQIILDRLHLEQRTGTQLLLSENDSKGLQWLSDTVFAINFGKHPDFSLPQRITVFLPETVMRRSDYDLTIIDTKGIHGTTERSDLQAMIADPRTLSILCCTFNDAPGQESLKIMKSLKGIGSDAMERQRILLLALPRADEALKVIDDSGEPVESAEEGYAFRAHQVSDTLRAADLPDIPLLYFNAMDDSSGDVWKELCNHIDALRSRQMDRLSRFVFLASELMTNADAHRIQQARIALAAEAKAIASAYARMPTSVRTAQHSLLREMRESHPSTIAAAVVRKGSWYNLEVHHMVGIGVRSDAFLRTSDLVTKINGRLDALRDRFAAVPEAVALVDSLAEKIGDWHQEFLTRAQSIGKSAFKPYMDADDAFWSKLRQRYGEGPGYRDEIVESVERWFERPILNPARAKVDEKLEQAWGEIMLDQFVEVTVIEADAVEGA